MVVVNGNTVGVGTSLSEALTASTSGQPTEPGGGGETPPPTGSLDEQVAGLLNDALQHFTAADVALRAGDLATYQSELAIAQALVQQANDLVAAARRVGTSPSPSSSPSASPSVGESAQPPACSARPRRLGSAHGSHPLARRASSRGRAGVHGGGSDLRRVRSRDAGPSSVRVAADRIGARGRVRPRCGMRHGSVRRDGDRGGSRLRGCGSVGRDAQRGEGEVARCSIRARRPAGAPLRGFVRWGHVHRRDGERPSRGVAGRGVGLRSRASAGRPSLPDDRGDRPSCRSRERSPC